MVDLNSNLQEVELKKPGFIEPLVTEEGSCVTFEQILIFIL